MRRKGMSDTSEQKRNERQVERDVRQTTVKMFRSIRRLISVAAELRAHIERTLVGLWGWRRVHDALPPHSKWIYWTNKVHEKCTQNISIMLLPLGEMVEVVARALLLTRRICCVCSTVFAAKHFAFSFFYLQTFCCHFLLPNPFDRFGSLQKRNSILWLS